MGEADYWFLIPLSLFGVPVIVTLFWMGGALIGYWCAGRPLGRLMMMLTFVGMAEWGREFIATGFPWNAPGLIFLGTDMSAAWAAYFGQTGLNFLALIAAGLLPFFILIKPYHNHKTIRLSALIIMAFLLAGLAYGSVAHYQGVPLQPADEATGIRVVQPAVPQADKWVYEKRTSHMDRLAALSIASASRPIDLVLWPETAFAGDYQSESDEVDRRALMIANHHQAKGGAGQLLSGILRFDEQDRLFNSALLIAEDGTKARYDKSHLVPFGEYVPWRFIPFIDAIAGPRDFIEGSEVRPIFVPHFGLVLPLICYEAIFPALTGRATSRPHLIVNVTNDGWFGHTAGPYQHLAQTRMTAISYGIALVRVANSGISAAFDGKGRKIASLDLGKRGYFDLGKPATYPPTIFARYSFMISLAMFFVFGLVAIILDRLREKRQ